MIFNNKLLLLLKPTATGQSGENKIAYKLLSQPHKHLCHRKLKNTTQGSNQRLIAPLNPSNAPVSNTSVGKVIPHMSMGQRALKKIQFKS